MPAITEAKEQKIYMFKTKAEADKKAKEISGKVVALTKQNFAVVKEDVNEATAEEAIEDLSEGVISDVKEIVANKQAKKIQGVMVDLFTASAISQIYDKVNDANKAKMDKMKITQLANAAMKMMKRESLDEQKDDAEYNDEGGMAISQLKTAKSAVEELMSIIKDDDNLPEWVQSKLTKAVDYMDSVRDYMASETGEVQEAVKTTHVVIDTADGNKIVATASSEQDAKSSVASAERPPMNIKNKKTLKIVKLKRPVGDKQVDRMVGYPLEEAKYDSDKFFDGKGTPEQRTQLLKLQNKALRALAGSPKQKAIKKDIDALRKEMGMKISEEVELEEGSFKDIATNAAELKRLMKKPIKLGKNGDNAIEAMMTIVGDDKLMTDLFNAGKSNPSGDARDIIKKHAKRLGLKTEEVEMDESSILDEVETLEDAVKRVVEGKLDKVNPVAVKKDFKDRKDKDIDNDGDVDDSDEYLHKRRQAVSKSVKKESEDDADKTNKSDMDDNGILKKKKKKDGEGNKSGEPVDINPSITEADEMSDAEMKKREDIVLSMKDKIPYFKSKYGKRWKDVMYATATKMAMKD